MLTRFRSYFVALSMPSFLSFIKSLSEEAGVSQKECTKVVAALNSILVKEVQARGSYQIPKMIIIRRKTIPAKEGGLKKAFGK